MKQIFQILLCCTFLFQFNALQAQQTKAAAKIDKGDYIIEIKQADPCIAGKPCKVEITLKTKGEFHINDKYPVKFKPNEGPAIEIPPATPKPLTKEVTISGSFVGSSAGAFVIGGVLSFGLIKGTEQKAVNDGIKFKVEVSR